jgi:hypothetical protein
MYFLYRYGDKLTKESKLRDATEGREIELMRENASLRYIHLCTHIYTNISIIYTYLCICIHTYIYTYIYIYTHIYMYICTGILIPE